MKNTLFLSTLLFLMASCGATKNASSKGKPLKLTDAGFQSDILDNNKVSVVYFWATWCGPCKTTGPLIEEMAKAKTGNAVYGKVNVDKCPEITNKYGVFQIPTVLIIKDGVVKENYVGGFVKSTIAALVKKHS